MMRKEKSTKREFGVSVALLMLLCAACTTDTLVATKKNDISVELETDLSGTADADAEADTNIDTSCIVLVKGDLADYTAHDGSTWELALPTVQEGIDSAATAADQSGSDYCEVWVAQGIYVPTVAEDDGDPKTVTIQLKPGTALYGGFVGNETARDQRDFSVNVTTLSGKINGSDSAYHVVTGSNDAVIDGFTITEGRANVWIDQNQVGGGMYNSLSSPVVTNCTFSHNAAGQYGGGMYNDRSSPTITGCTFFENSADDFGGGIYNNSSSPTVTSSTFLQNSAKHGGGMYNNSTSSTVINCIFSQNGSLHGGGIYNIDTSSTVTNCMFFENSSTDYGGGIYNDSTSSTVSNCTFSGNSANNALIDGGGGMYISASSSSIVTNCIMWGDVENEIVGSGLSSLIVTYSDVQGAEYAGMDGNISEDPLFVSSTDLRLQADSPCINAGDVDSLPQDITDMDGDDIFSELIPLDLDGYVRTTGDAVDMGAYERQDNR